MSALVGRPRARGLRRALLHPSFTAGLVLTLVLVALAALSLAWTPHDPTLIDIAARLRPPSLSNPLGTDQFGRDVLSMIMAGAVTSIAVSVVAVGIGMAIGVPIGLAAAAAGGTADLALMRLSDFLFAFPALLVAILLREVFGPGAFNAMLAIGIFNVPVFARVAHGAALPLWTRDFVSAARMAGKGPALITLEHILPNIAAILIVQATIQLSLGILAESALSYVGLGVQPPRPSWGRMLNEAQTLMAVAPRLAIVPGLAIVLAVLGLNLLGDGVRDLVDPRLSRGR